jgi:hypothetical protein
MTALMIASYRGQLTAVQRLMAEKPPPSIEMRDVVFCEMTKLKKRIILVNNCPLQSYFRIIGSCFRRILSQPHFNLRSPMKKLMFPIVLFFALAHSARIHGADMGRGGQSFTDCRIPAFACRGYCRSRESQVWRSCSRIFESQCWGDFPMGIRSCGPMAAVDMC